MIQSQEDLQRAFLFLAKHDLNHKNTIHQNYILHEFVVPYRIINSMQTTMQKYKEQQELKRLERQNRQKFNGTTQIKPTQKRKKKYVLKRENKYKRRRAALSIATIVLLSSLIFGGVTMAKNRTTPLEEKPEIVMTTDERTNELLDEYENHDEILPHAEETSDELVNISGKVDEINHNLDENNFDYSLDIYADDWTGTTKYVDCYNNYNELVTKYANMYGIDPKVALAIGCHERGTHSNEIDGGGGLGLYQIQVSVWDGHDVRAFNFETNEWETYTIELDNIRNLENNVKAGMMIFQDCLRRDDYNVAMAVQEYNFGHGGLMSAINAAAEHLGVDSEVLEQNGNTEWFDYRTYNKSSKGYQMGDPDYVENVFKYINDGEILKFKTPSQDEITVKYNNLNNQMTMS